MENVGETTVKQHTLLTVHTKGHIEVGLDEAGRGSLIGPVFAAAVAWDPELTADKDPIVAKIKDSKKLSKKQRASLRDYIEKNAKGFAVSYSGPEEIDRVNKLQATFNAMHRCLDSLKCDFDTIIVDGPIFRPYIHKERGFMPHNSVIDGDNKYTSIAAASILAKVYHDEYIMEMIKNNPELDQYDLAKNMGYGTKKHLDALKRLGPTQWHRKSFKVCSGV